MKCTKCGTEFNGNFCPKCGAGAEKKKLGCLKIGLIVLGVFVALIIFAAIVGSSSSSPASNGPTNPESSPASQSASQEPTPEPTPEYIEVTASELLAAYDENTVAADNTYKGQLLKVTGTVGSIGKDVMDAAYVTLTSGEPYALVSVQCYFANDNLDDIATLKEGDTVTITGKCDGSTLNVMLKQCDLVVE